MRLFLLIAIFLYAFVSSAQQGNYQTLLLDKTLTKDANAVVRSDWMHIDIVSKKKMVIKAKKVVTVLNKMGVKHARTVVGYDDSKKVKDLEIIIYDALGQQADKIKKKEFKDVSAADGFSLYLDYRLLYHEYTPISYPYTLEFNYELESSDTGIIPTWYFLNGFSVGVEKSSFSISYANPNLKPVIQEKNIEGLQLSKEDTGNTISYSAENIPAMKAEVLSPPLQKVVPKLMSRIKDFHYKGHEASVDNWKELGRWVDKDLLAGRDALDEGTKAMARNLVKGVDDNLEKAKIIYKYVQDNTRYISVQIGIGGFQPISAIDVDQVKYGDCKGLSNYTMSLLKAVGVTAYYAVVEAGSDKIDFEDDFADLAQGNHAILAIPYKDKYYWIDCTSQVLPFGFIGSFTDDRKVMIVTPEGGKIVRTTAYINEQNHQKIDATYTLSADGSIVGDAHITTQGSQYYRRFRLHDESEKEVVKNYKEQWSNINNLNVAKYELENDREQVLFSENATLDAVNYASISGNRILFTVNAFNNNGYVPHRYRNRSHPFEIQRGFLDEDVFTVQLPEGYEVEAIPQEVELQGEFGSYLVSFEHRPDSKTIRYKRSLLIKKGLYPKEKYTAYRDFRKKIAATDDAQVVLVKK